MGSTERRFVIFVFQRSFQLTKRIIPQKHAQKFNYPLICAHPPDNIRVIAPELFITLFDSHHKMISS